MRATRKDTGLPNNIWDDMWHRIYWLDGSTMKTLNRRIQRNEGPGMVSML